MGASYFLACRRCRVAIHTPQCVSVCSDAELRAQAHLLEKFCYDHVACGATVTSDRESPFAYEEDSYTMLDDDTPFTLVPDSPAQIQPPKETP